MKSSEKKEILRKLYEAACYLDGENGVDRIKAEKYEECLENMQREIGDKKKQIPKGLSRLQRKYEALRKKLLGW